MLRALLLVMFLAANAALAAVQLGWLTWHDMLPATGREPARVEMQLEPERIRLIGAEIGGQSPATAAASAANASRGPSGADFANANANANANVRASVTGTGTDGAGTGTGNDSQRDTDVSLAAASAVSASAPAAASQVIAATGPSAVSGDAPASQTTAATNTPICLDVGPFPANDAQSARGLLLAALPAGQGDLQSVALDKRYWVHLNPVPNKAAADKQIAQLRSAGVTEYFLLNDDNANLVVSLGLFNDRERAMHLMAAAQKKGITPQLNERPNAKSRIVYRIVGINANIANQVRGVVTQQWSAKWVKTCPPPAVSPPA